MRLAVIMSSENYETGLTAYALTQKDSSTIKKIFEQGINATNCSKEADFIVFLDPQEVPHAEKLYALKAGQHRVKALTLLLKIEEARGCDPELLGILQHTIFYPRQHFAAMETVS